MRDSPPLMAASLCASIVIGLAGSRAAPVSKGTGTMTIYYIAEVNPERVDSGGVQVKTKDGELRRFRVSNKELAKANLEGTAFSRNPDGEIAIVNFVRRGFWVRVPDGWEGMGNKSNPITPFKTVAADQAHHAYGSRVFIPSAKGFETPDGRVLDGYLWVADAGGGIKGRFRFDLFVGLDPNFEALQEAGISKWKDNVEVEALPAVRPGLNYKTAMGRRGILERLGYDLEGPLEILFEAIADIEDAGTTAEAALIHFQRQHPAIPKAEYGRGDSAITRWFLAQAAEAVAAGEEYPAKPPSGGEE